MFRKGIVVILCIIIVLTSVPTVSLGKENEIQPNTNGEFLISVEQDGSWHDIGSLYFNQFYSEEEIDISSSVKEIGLLKIRIIKVGGGAAQLDAVLLDGTPALRNKDVDNKLIDKLSNRDYDVINIDESGLALCFDKTQKYILTIRGRIEKEVISTEPFQFPKVNLLKPVNEDSAFYDYILVLSNEKLEGNIYEILNEKEPFLKEYCIPGSGHPNGYFYAWVGNDNDNLYVALDFTSDNTLDGKKDYAKVNIKTKDGVKEFKITQYENQWGNALFTYTDKVDYEHKVYEFIIPLSDIGELNQEIVPISFTAYGTATSVGFYEVDEDEESITIDIPTPYRGEEYEPDSIDVDYFTTFGGTAVNDEDFIHKEGSITFTPEMETQPLVIEIVNDNQVEDNEYFYVNISYTYNDSIYNGYIEIFIYDDDEQDVEPEPTQPFFDFTAPRYTVNENDGVATISVRFTSGKGEVTPQFLANNIEFLVEYYTDIEHEESTATPNTDYTPVRDVLEFTEDEQTLYFEVPIIDDTEDEENETVILKLEGPIQQGPQLQLVEEAYIVKEAILTIEDNDPEIPPEDPDPDPTPDPEPEERPEKPTKVEEEKEPDAGIIIRKTLYEPISKAIKIEKIKDEIELVYDQSVLEKGKYNYARVCYFNKDANKWVALSTYLIEEGKVKAINDGGYKGWFKVFGNIQPNFVDLEDSKIEYICNRLNGLGVFEGFPIENHANNRMASLEKPITRRDFLLLVYRLLSLDEQSELLPKLSSEEIESLLAERFQDADSIPKWSRDILATMTYVNLIDDIDGKLEINLPIKQIDGVKIINNALKLMGKYEEIKFDDIADDENLPDWAKISVDDKEIEAYLENNNELDSTISREEALITLYEILILQIGW